MSENTYFVNKPTQERAGVIMDKIDKWGTSLDTSGYMEKLKTMWRAYHGIYFQDGSDGHQITFAGEQGELVQISVNHIHNICKVMLNMITATRPTMQARAVNTDYKSLVQTKLANGLLDYYMRDKRLEDYLRKAVEHSIVFGSGYVKMEWNATAGEVYDFNEDLGIEIREGDLQFSNLFFTDVFFDTNREDDNHDWIITRSWKNRYDLAAKYPEFREEILALPTKSQMSHLWNIGFGNQDTDEIAVYEFYHKRTESVPEGLYQLQLSQDVVLLESPMPYRALPVYCIKSGQYLGTPFAYSPMFDLLPIQDAINSLYSTILTNQTAFGVQSILVPQNANINISKLSDGMTAIEYNQQLGEIKPLQLTATPKEIFDNIALLESKMETLSGINAVSRGNPPDNLRSGNALALVQSMSLQYISGLQQSYVSVVEDLGTGMINTLKDHASVPRVATIVGKNNRTYLEEFTGDKLSAVNRVVVDIGNPLARTTAGRVEMAEQLLQMSAIKTPEQYFMVINTGQLDVMTEDVQSELYLIKAENERLVTGQPVASVFTDEHALHIKEHRTVLADPSLRFDQELFARVSEHIQEHVDLLRTTDPNVLGILGQQPLSPPGGTPNAPSMPQEIANANVPESNLGGPLAATQLAQVGATPQDLPSIPVPPPETQANPALALQQAAILTGKQQA